MPVFSVAEAQQWLEDTKLTIARLDTELAQSAEEFVFAQVAGVYDTSTWVSTTATPSLISKITSIFYASWFYQRQYSENELDENNYAMRLEARAMLLLQGIASGAVDLPGVEAPVTGLAQPAFFPMDNSIDEYGHAVDAKFSMNMGF